MMMDLGRRPKAYFADETTVYPQRQAIADARAD